MGTKETFVAEPKALRKGCRKARFYELHLWVPLADLENIEALDDAQRFQLLLQSVIDYAIYLLSIDGRVLTWNSGAERVKGYHAEEIIGRHFSDFYTPEDRKLGLPQKSLELSLIHI